MAQLSLAKFFAGNWDSARTIADEARATELPGAFAGPADGLLLRLPAYAGDWEGLLQLADRSSGAKGFSTIAQVDPKRGKLVRISAVILLEWHASLTGPANWLTRAATVSP